jgi:magnesium transporter
MKEQGQTQFIKELKMDLQGDQQGIRRKLFKHRTPPGSMPGSLVSDPEAPFPRIQLLGWSDGEFEENESVSVEDLGEHLLKWPMTWVNVDGLGDTVTLQKIAETFGVHKLAMEDVVHVHQRAKVEEYEERLFIVIRMPYLTDDGVRTEQLSIFLGPGFVLTFQEKEGDCLDPVRERVRKSKGRIRHAGSDYLAYAILDAVVDSWFPILEDYGETLQDLENEILDNPASEIVGEIHLVKRDLLEIRRIIWPMRETVNVLFKDEGLIQRETHIYLRDCYDHVIQIIDIVESYRDMASGLMELYLSSVSNNMNQVMKVLTIIATIFIPLTFIAGIYGMNFNPEASVLNMPELNWKYGYVAVWLLMLGIGGVMVFFFKRRGWLGSRKGSGN